VLQWARAHGADWGSPDLDSDYDCAALAARGGHLEVLRWLWETDYEWDDPWTCACAAAGGHLNVLKWLREAPRNFHWDARTVEEASEGGHDDVLQWALAHGCPTD
jgi:hypothetical protein